MLCHVEVMHFDSHQLNVLTDILNTLDISASRDLNFWPPSYTWSNRSCTQMKVKLPPRRLSLELISNFNVLPLLQKSTCSRSILAVYQDEQELCDETQRYNTHIHKDVIFQWFHEHSFFISALTAFIIITSCTDSTNLWTIYTLVLSLISLVPTVRS